MQWGIVVLQRRSRPWRLRMNSHYGAPFQSMKSDKALTTIPKLATQRDCRSSATSALGTRFEVDLYRRA